MTWTELAIAIIIALYLIPIGVILVFTVVGTVIAIILDKIDKTGKH